MSRWFRFYDDVLNDPKVQRLPADMFRAWVNMLCLASKNGGAMVRADIAFALRVSERRAAAIIDYLVEHNLLEDRGDVVVPHNWDRRQFKSDSDPTNNERQKRHRNTKRNASRNGPSNGPNNGHNNGPRNAPSNGEITPLEQSRTDTESEQIDRDGVTRDLDALEDEFRNVAKATIDDLYGLRHQLDALLHRGFSRQTILAGAARAMHGKRAPPSLAYFVKCIESENEERSSPAKPEQNRGKPETIVDVARRFAAQGIGFGPKPSLLPSGGDGGGNVVRMLPEGGGE